jgi:hypothetical protein
MRWTRALSSRTRQKMPSRMFILRPQHIIEVAKEFNEGLARVHEMFSLHHDGATGKKNPLCRLTQYTSPSACDVIFVCYSAGGARTQCRAGITKKGRCRTGCYVRMRVCMRVGMY